MELIEGFEKSIVKLNLEVVHLYYASDFIYNFKSLKELIINYSQFVIFDSYTQIEQIITNNLDMSIFEINDNYEKKYGILVDDFEDICYMIKTQRTRKQVFEIVAEGVSYNYENNMHIAFCVHCEEYRTKYETNDVIKISGFDVMEIVRKVWKNKTINIIPYMSSNISKVNIYFRNGKFTQNTFTKKNVLEMCNFRNGILSISNNDENYNDSYISLDELENLLDTVEELHIDHLQKPIKNLPMGIKRIALQENIYISESKIPFGCEICVCKESVEEE
jgi:hypothetical protein